LINAQHRPCYNRKQKAVRPDERTVDHRGLNGWSYDNDDDKDSREWRLLVMNAA